LRQLASAIAQHVPAEIENVPSAAAERRYRMFEAFTGLLHAISVSRPVLLVLEDMHWADSGSVLLLRHIIRSMRESAVCTIITLRDSELPQESWFSDLWTGLYREPSATRVALRGLRHEHIACLVNACTGLSATNGLTRLLAEDTGGNPLFLAELLRHVRESEYAVRLETLPPTATIGDLGVPQSLSELVALRVSRLGPDCHRHLTLASVVGREFSLPVVEALACVREELLFECIDAAVKARIVQEVPEQPGRFSFTHEIVREVLYSRQTAGRRARLHHQIAEILERQSRVTKQSLADLAHHFARAASFRDAEKAVEYAVRAAEDSARRLALEQAARLYGMAMQALEYLPADSQWHRKRLHLHEQRGRWCLQAGQWSFAQEEFAAAMRIAESGPDMELKGVNYCSALRKPLFGSWTWPPSAVLRVRRSGWRIVSAMRSSPPMRSHGSRAPRLPMVTCSARLRWIAAPWREVLVSGRSGEPACP
jgi:predicted ATPase